jgi:3-hydroxyisobutyrate dehydrogenase-like beta-hydroxyacid dehydrogenase
LRDGAVQAVGDEGVLLTAFAARPAHTPVAALVAQLLNAVVAEGHGELGAAAIVKLQ